MDIHDNNDNNDYDDELLVLLLVLVTEYKAFLTPGVRIRLLANPNCTRPNF